MTHEKEKLAVAETLRQAADLAGNYKNVLMTEELLRRMATELDPDYVEPDAAVYARTRSGFEAVGRASVYGYLNFHFVPTDGFDLYTWGTAYRIGYFANRFALPAIRPRIRAKAICVRYAPYPLG